MKNLFSITGLSIKHLITLLALFAFIRVIGQGDNLDYDKYVQLQTEYFARLQEQLPPEETPAGMKGFNRYKDFWDSRVGYSETEAGSYEMYFAKKELPIRYLSFQINRERCVD